MVKLTYALRRRPDLTPQAFADFWLNQHNRLVAEPVRDAGFDPVLIGGLARAQGFDVGSPVYASNMRGLDVRQTLGLPASSSGRSL